MADEFYSELDTITSLFDADWVTVDHDPTGTIETNKIAFSDVVQEFMYRTNYRLARTAPSNNLLVTLKNANNADASATRPLSFCIAGNIRKLTSSLSLQVNNAANTFNLGATEFVNLAQELFVYVGWRASDSSIFLLLSRMPYCKEFAEFSTTATSERYGAVTGTTPAGTDPVINVGRVNVQNAGSGSSYNWSIPAADTVINRAIYQTSWLDWLPTFTGFTATVPTGVHRYKIDYTTLALFARETANGTSNANSFTMSLPFTAKTITNMAWGSAGVIFDNGVIVATPGLMRVVSAATVMDVFKDFTATNIFTTSNGKRVSQMNPMTYEIGV